MKTWFLVHGLWLYRALKGAGSEEAFSIAILHDAKRIEMSDLITGIPLHRIEHENSSQINRMRENSHID